jgi:hypothetical protein
VKNFYRNDVQSWFSVEYATELGRSLASSLTSENHLGEKISETAS